MASPTNNSKTLSELESQPLKSAQTGTETTTRWGRIFSRISTNENGAIPANTIPVSFNQAAAGGGAGCCGCIGVIMMIVGGIMWGACKDEGDCNPAVKRAGKITFFVGTGILSLDICCCLTVLGVGCALSR